MFACPAPPPASTPRADRPRYELRIHVPADFELVTGDVTVTFTPNRSTKLIVFRLWPNGPRQLALGMRLDVGRATVDGNAPSATKPDPTTLVLHSAVRARQTVTVHIAWRLRVPRNPLDRIARWRDGLRLGTFFPILPWDPRRGWVTDAPARILSESATTPTADFDVHIDVPHGMVALVSGTRVGTDHWHAHAVRDVGVSVGHFRIATETVQAPNPVTVQVGVADNAQNVHVVLARAVHALTALSRRYGPYRWRTYTVSVSPDLNEVGIEYPTLIFIGAGGLLHLIVDHETAHQWFYSLVGNDQAKDPWLDEALASWSQVRLGSGGIPGVGAIPVQRQVGESVSHFTGRDAAYFREIYVGGVQALSSFGAPRRVDCGLKLYAAREAFAIAQPGDLLDVLNRVIPGAERRLRRFGIHR